LRAREYVAVCDEERSTAPAAAAAGAAEGTTVAGAVAGEAAVGAAAGGADAVAGGAGAAAGVAAAATVVPDASIKQDGSPDCSAPSRAYRTHPRRTSSTNVLSSTWADAMPTTAWAATDESAVVPVAWVAVAATPAAGLGGSGPGGMWLRA
jgi:hypothetical protein